MGLFSKNQSEKQRGKTLAELKLEKIITRVFGDDLEEKYLDKSDGFYNWNYIHESTRVTAHISKDLGSEDNPIIRVFCPCVMGARDDDKLYRYLMTGCERSIFSQFRVFDGEEKGTVNVHVEMYLSLNTVSDDDFETTYIAVARSSNDNDDEIVKRFGGETWEEWY